MPRTVTSIATTDDLFELLDEGRDTDDGEGLDLLAHGLQCASLLVAVAPEDVELQVAGLVHDLGTMLVPGAPATHAETGGAAVARLLGERVAALVAHHDQAKRYLVTVDPRYRSLLSAQSLATLRVQGGLLDPDERARFERLPVSGELLSLRRADDAAKVPGRRVAGLDEWRPVVEHVAARVPR